MTSAAFVMPTSNRRKGDVDVRQSVTEFSGIKILSLEGAVYRFQVRTSLKQLYEPGSINSGGFKEKGTEPTPQPINLEKAPYKATIEPLLSFKGLRVASFPIQKPLVGLCGSTQKLKRWPFRSTLESFR